MKGEEEKKNWAGRASVHKAVLRKSWLGQWESLGKHPPLKKFVLGGWPSSLHLLYLVIAWEQHGGQRVEGRVGSMTSE